jgi:anti-sigma factor RsiW
VSAQPGKTITCRQFVELATDYLEGRLAAAERERFEDHLALCPGCQAYMDQMEATLRALGHIPEESLSPSARDELLHVFREWRTADRLIE